MSGLFGKLLAAAKEDLKRKDFKNIVSAVQKKNIYAIKLFRKLGFSIEEKKDKPKSYKLVCTKTKMLKNFHLIKREVN